MLSVGGVVVKTQTETGFCEDVLCVPSAVDIDDAPQLILTHHH